MLVGTLRVGKSVRGYVHKGLIEIRSLVKWHDLVVEEMIKRNMKHCTPLEVMYLPDYGKVDSMKSIRELRKRCPECRQKLGVLGNKGRNYDSKQK